MAALPPTSFPPLLPSRSASLLPNGQSSTTSSIIPQTRKRDHQSCISNGSLSDSESERTSHNPVSKRAKIDISSSNSIAAIAGTLSTLRFSNTVLVPQPKEDRMEGDKVIDPLVQRAIKNFLIANFVYEVPEIDCNTRARSGKYIPPEVPLRPILYRTIKISNLFVSGITASKILKRFKSYGATSVTLPLLNLQDKKARELSLQNIQFNLGFAFILFSTDEQAQLVINSYLNSLSSKSRRQRRKASASGSNAFVNIQLQGLALTSPRLELAATQEVQKELFRMRAGACARTYHGVGNRIASRMDIAKADPAHFKTSYLGELFRSFKPVKPGAQF